MTDVIGRGVVAIEADTTGATAGIEKVKRSVKSLGDDVSKSSARNSASIDRYVQKLVTQANTFGRTSREIELYTLKLRGASAAQLQAANTALTLVERQKEVGDSIAAASRFGARAGLAIAAGITAATYAIDQLIKRVGGFQDIAEKIGDTASNVASLSVAAAIGGTSMDAVGAASVKLNKNLLGVDDESKDAGAALEYLGIKLKDIKGQAPTEQLRTIAKAMAEIEDSTSKTNVATALFGRSGSENLPFLKELGNETERINILSTEQLRIADEYSDKQAKAVEITKQSIAAFALDYVPAIMDTIDATLEWVKVSGTGEIALTALRGALTFAGVAFQTIALIASDVIFVFKGVGREVAAIAAQLVALANLDFNGFNAISVAVKEDAERARRDLDKFQERIANIGKESSQAIAAAAAAQPEPKKKPRPPFTGGTGKGKKDNTAEQERKAQLTADLADIKQQSEGIRAIYAADSKVLEAQRSANLISERAYYNEKRNLLILNQQEQEVALQKEIARMEIEKVAGKDKIENERKILTARHELQKLRTSGDADLKVLGIQEAESIAKVARAYQDATIAAKEYLATVARRNRAEVAGLGAGEKSRTRQSELNGIEDRFLSEKARLERDKRNAGDNEPLKKQLDEYLEVARKTYAEEVKLYEERTDAIEAKQRDWVTGYNEALQNYIDKSRDIAKLTEGVFDNMFSSLEDTITEFITKGKLNLKGLFDGIAVDITKAIVKQKLGEFAAAMKGDSDSIAGKAFSAIGGLIGGGKGTPAAGAVGAATGAAGVAAQSAAITANTAAISTNTASVSSAAASATALATAETTASATIATSSAASVTALTALVAAASAASTALALVAASATAKSGGDALGAFISAGSMAARATGGPVQAGGLYRVNERGPEMLQVAGKEFLMMGSQAGKVLPNSGGSGGSTTIVQVSVTPPAGSSRETAMQWGNNAGRALGRATRRNG